MDAAIADFPTGFVVSAQWLNDHLDDPRIVIVDCRFALMQPGWGRQQYQAAHIPGAFYLDLNQDLSGEVRAHGGRHPLPEVSTLVATLQRLGINSAPVPTQVIVYDDARLGFAARLWWLLRYLGHDQVAVLDGGWGAWQAAGYAVSATVPALQTGRFMPNLRMDWVVDRLQVLDRMQGHAAQGGTVLVDSREGDRYRGEREPIDPVAGHIPGAVNYPWQEVTDESGFVRSPLRQRQRWQALDPTQEVVVYCGSGVTACVNLFALALAGFPPGKLYAGSWSDWCSYLLDGSGLDGSGLDGSRVDGAGA
jgi:thiosulfate/3-mercaptopyruvate sulfurtransferase